VSELVQEVGRLITELRELLDDRLPLTEPTLRFVPGLTQQPPEVFCEFFDLVFRG
jgi:hypothetical protein